MSHFIGLCFGASWEYDLEQYYEGLEVDAYIRYTKEEAIERAKESYLREYEYAKKHINDDSLTKERFKTYTEILNKGCSLTNKEAWEIVKEWGYEMDDKENLLTTYNPDSKWDWYEIGGRWSGFLPLKEKDQEGNPLSTNEAYFNEIDWDYLFDNKYPPFCFVTEDGEWIEKGEMGWWGIAINEKPEDDWDTQFKEYLKTVDPNCLVTVIDFHI